ncbi:conserved hypothetical protein [Thiomonas arsenitoxydans]|uniref:Uncharacterized protein n=1 Tax=Thiomonas arsenitoxydans (strain DSM 22701 / CIP 110005 / 3As) TaxID=426114 RepID=D6CS30_THIA3|nr:hypothetical protein THI_0699 [Thiomonas arsenitoxydans]CQR29241.1 conserved hypothetical protein [Thiomonas arsenitoxydans]
MTWGTDTGQPDCTVIGNTWGLSVAFRYPRTGAPDPRQPAAGTISAARKLSFVLLTAGESAARQVLKFGVLRPQRKRNTLRI